MLDSDYLQSWRWKLQLEPSSESRLEDNNLTSVSNCGFEHSSMHELFKSVSKMKEKI